MEQSYGLLGGTFNPPHLGHARAAELVKQRLGLQKVIFMPAAVPPHKPLPEGSPGPADRLAMTRLLTEPLPYAEVSDYEMAKGGVSYTVETVHMLRQSCPGGKLYLICGSDMFLTLETWYRAAELLALCTVAALHRGTGEDAGMRDQAGFLEREFGARSILIDDPALAVSSSELRECIAAGCGMDYLPKKVYDYICAHHFYGAGG